MNYKMSTDLLSQKTIFCFWGRGGCGGSLVVVNNGFTTQVCSNGIPF